MKVQIQLVRSGGVVAFVERDSPLQPQVPDMYRELRPKFQDGDEYRSCTEDSRFFVKALSQEWLESDLQ